MSSPLRFLSDLGILLYCSTTVHAILVHVIRSSTVVVLHNMYHTNIVCYLALQVGNDINRVVGDMRVISDGLGSGVTPEQLQTSITLGEQWLEEIRLIFETLSLSLIKLSGMIEP